MALSCCDMFQEAERYGTTIQFLFYDMSNKLREMNTVLENDVINVLYAAIEDYLAMNISKSELSAILQSYVVRNALTSVVADGHDFVSSCYEATQQANLQLLALQTAYTELYSTTVPIIDSDVLVNLTYIEYLLYYGSNGTNAVMTSLYDDPMGTTLAVLHHMYYEVFIQELTTVREELKIRLNAMAEAASDLEDDLESYAASLRMNYEFYT